MVHIGMGWTVGIQVGETVHNRIIPVRPKCSMVHIGTGWTVGIQVGETVHHGIIPVGPKCTMGTHWYWMDSRNSCRSKGTSWDYPSLS